MPGFGCSDEPFPDNWRKLLEAATGGSTTKQTIHQAQALEETPDGAARVAGVSGRRT